MEQNTGKIYTGYFAKVKELEEHGILPISISRRAPDWYHGLQYKKLAPSYRLLMNYKYRMHDDMDYTKQFNSEVLETLDAADVVRELRAMAGDRDIALLCYEKPSDFCHRQLVAEWLERNGFSCREWSRMYADTQERRQMI